MQPRAVIVLAVGIARGLECGHRSVPVAGLLADHRKRKPGGGEARRGFHHLFQNFGGRGGIALLEIIERPAVAPVGDQIAR